ncbi:MAG: type II toxin-antitoxin system VapC family toxin [Acidobacteriota bacterium]|nr:type II toxin-antitoxin system VapC family toxin [Acidobacteriota bacterium]
MNKSYYADSSALIKRHAPETGSVWIKQEFSPIAGNEIITSKLSIAEVLSGLNRRKRETSISAADYGKFSKDFTAVSRFQYRLIDLTDAILLEAQRLLENHPLRAGDAIQLASALLANAGLQSANLPALIFLASDARLLTAATSEGLQTDDPQNH